MRAAWYVVPPALLIGTWCLAHPTRTRVFIAAGAALIALLAVGATALIPKTVSG